MTRTPLVRDNISARRRMGAVAYAALCIALVFFLFSCSGRQVQRDYEHARAGDTIAGYEAFARKHPKSEYSDRISQRVKQLQESEKLKEEQRERTRAEYRRKLLPHLNAENVMRIKKLNSYSIGKTTLSQFIDDGWNADDPYSGKLGIVGVSHGENSIHAQKSVNIIMGFTYKTIGREKDAVVPAFLAKSQKAVLESEMRILKKKNSTTRTDVKPLMTDKDGMRWTKKELDLRGGPHAVEPFHESVAVVKFKGNVLEAVDLSGIKHLDLPKVFGAELYNCTIDKDWLAKTARKSTRVPLPTTDEVLTGFSEQGLDTIRITYDPRDEANLGGTGSVRGEQLLCLVTKQHATFLSGREKQSGIVKSAVLERAVKKLRVNLGLDKGKELSIEYLCEQVSPTP